MDIDKGMVALEKVIGPLLGDEREMLVECACAGLYYERGELFRAHALALSAITKIRDDFVPESRFCVMMTLAAINYAMRQFDQAESIFADIWQMIEEKKAFYLKFNFEAMICQYRLSAGDPLSAHNWLDTGGTNIYGHLSYFRLYGHFATARAYIVLGEFDKAIILLRKIIELCGKFRRTIDIIESEVLLSIALWKKRRGHQKEALVHLGNAVDTAYPYGYTQVFINEGAELLSILAKLKNRTIQRDYAGTVSGTFIKMLYLRVAEQAQYGEGLTAGRPGKTLQFTQRQKCVMELLCRGCSYKEAAEKLGIKYSTVRSHIELIYKNLDVSDEKEAVLKIRSLHILDKE
jgi:LuxR family maltose regulon positive regulatory protein